jgi:hypothetical protein
MDGDSGTVNSIVMSTHNGSSVAERLRILTGAADGIQVTGNVGIGYDSPADNIHILGSNASPNVGITLQSDDTANATAAISLMARTADNSNRTSEIKNVAGQLFIERSDAGTDVLALKSTAAGAGGPQLDFYHHSASPADNDVIGTINFNGWDDASNATTYARMSGIAADVSNGAEKGHLVFSNRADGSTFSESMRIDSSGNVVINKASFSSLPTGSKLNIFGDGVTLRLDGSGGTTKSILFRGTNAANPGEVYADGSLRFRTEDASTRITFHTNSDGSDNERMRIDSSGNVGIGTAPHADWRSEATALQISPLGAIWNTSNYEDFNIGNNVYTDGTEKYIQNDAACKIRLTDAGLMDFRVAVAGSADAAITWNTAMAINTTGQIGIGTDYTGNGLLRVGRAPSAQDGGQRTVFADGTHDAITTNSTNYLHNVWIQNNNFDIDSGVTDSGYRIGLNIEGYHDNSNLAGTLATQKNVWSRNGNNSGGAGTITNSYNMHLETLDGGGITITNNYGLYQTGAGTKNYFEGDVGIGTASPDTLLHVKGAAALTGTTGGAAGLSIAYDGGNSSPLYFGTETTSAQKSMYMSGYWIYLRGHQNEGIRFVYSQGSGSAPRSDQYEFKYNSATRPTGNTTWDGFSDVRAKENVQNITGALDTISQLRPVVFDWTDDYADTMNMFKMDETDPKSYNWTSVKENGYDLIRKNGKIGFIAQEFETVFPKDITELEVQLGDEKVEDFKTVNYDSLIPTLTKAIQEQQAQIQALQQRLDDLEG